MKKIICLILILSLTAFIPYSVKANTPNTTIKQIGCVLRNDGTGWYILNNEGHDPLNVSYVEVSGNFIILYYDSVAYKVITFSVTPDETFCNMGIIPGASVGLGSANILITKEQPNLKCFVTRENGNFVSYYKEYVLNTTWNETTGELTITHDLNDGYDVSLFNRNPSVTAIVSDTTGAMSANKTVIKFVKNGQFYKPVSDSEVQLYFSKSAKRKIINPNDLISTSGNLWIHGLVEVQN